MAWLEIISIRLSNQEDVGELLSIFRQIAETMPVSAQYDCYKSANVDSDWTIALQHSDEATEPGKSRLGRMIIEALRPYGLVNHMALVKQCVLGNEAEAEK